MMLLPGKFAVESGPRRQRGVSLIELMIALTLATILTLMIVTTFSATSGLNKVQDGLARMQENGRYAVSRIQMDLRMATARTCSTLDSVSGKIVDQRQSARWPTAHVDLSVSPTLFGPTGAAAFYPLSPRFMLSGHECSAAGTCTPNLGVAGTGADRLPNPVTSASIPAVGTADGSRAGGADVLTLRYLNSVGVPLAVSRSTGNPFVVSSGSALGASSGDLVWVSGCNSSDIFRANISGNEVTPTGNFDDARIGAYEIRSDDPRVFNVSRDLATVSYYLRIKDDPSADAAPARRLSTLVRRANGRDEDLVDGVERLDFLYGVERQNGGLSYLTAAEVDASADCPPLPGGAANEPGCLWRGLKSVEIYLLLNTVNNVPGVPEPFRYSFLNNGSANTGGVYENPSALTTLTSGLPPENMLRREFRALVSLRNSNS